MAKTSKNTSAFNFSAFFLLLPFIYILHYILELISYPFPFSVTSSRVINLSARLQHSSW